MLMQIDGTILFVIVSFLIFLFLLKTILFSPITKVIEERDKFYAKNSKMESESKEKSKALLEQKETALNEARLEASSILATVNEEAKIKAQNLISEAKKQANDEIEHNQNKLDEESKTAKIETKTQVNDIVSSIVTQVLGEETRVELQDDEINRYLKI